MKTRGDRVKVQMRDSLRFEIANGTRMQFRLRQAGYISRYPLFSDSAVNAIYNYTQGYPRKIAMVCHDALEYLVMHKKEMVDKEIIQEIIQRETRIYANY